MADMAEAIAGFIERFTDSVESATRKAGEDEVEQLKTDIGIEVEYTNGHAIRSNPGQPPRMETGQLQESIFSEVTRPETNVVELKIGSTADYSYLLEVGGFSNWGEIAARPFLGPSMERFSGGGIWSMLEDLKQAK